MMNALSEACTDIRRNLLLFIVQGLMWLERRSFCFFFPLCGGSSCRFRFPVGCASAGALCACSLVSSWLMHRFFLGRGESSSAIHRWGTGPVAPVHSVVAVAAVLALAPSPVPCSCCLRCCFAGLGDGSILGDPALRNRLSVLRTHGGGVSHIGRCLHLRSILFLNLPSHLRWLGGWLHRNQSLGQWFVGGTVFDGFRWGNLWRWSAPLASSVGMCGACIVQYCRACAWDLLLCVWVG